MKPHPALVFAAALFTTALLPLSASAAPQRAIAYPVRSLHLRTTAQVQPGIDRQALLREMGEPTRRLSPDLWIYAGYYAPNDRDVQRDGCSSLLVIFSGEMVQGIKFVNRAAAQVYASSVTEKHPVMVVAAK